MGREQSGKREWNELPVPLRTAMVVVGGAETALKVWSLVDLARRPSEKVHGPKAAWAVSLALVNSVGALPLIYLAWGRQG